MTVARPRLVRLLAALAATALIGVPASLTAQDREPRCRNCDSVQRREEQRRESQRRERERGQQELERLKADFDRKMHALHAQEEAMEEDTSRAARERLNRLRREARDVQRKFNTELARVVREETRRAADEAPAERVRVETRRGTAEATAQMRGELAGAMQQPASGWVGVYLSTTWTSDTKDGQELVRFLDYPLIEAVEPGSPADRAGIAAGDKLIALAGRDVTEGSFPFEKLLQPGNKLSIRVRRGGETKSVVVPVARRPNSWGPKLAQPGVPPDPPNSIIEFPLPEPPKPPKPPKPPAVPAVPRAPTRVEVPQPALSAVTGALAGAELVPLRDEGLREVFGVKQGLLVLSVGRGSHAQRAGLRGGDVIVAAGGREAATLRALQRAIERVSEQRDDDERTLKLEIVRKKERKTVMLRW